MRIWHLNISGQFNLHIADCNWSFFGEGEKEELHLVRRWSNKNLKKKSSVHVCLKLLSMFIYMFSSFGLHRPGDPALIAELTLPR